MKQSLLDLLTKKPFVRISPISYNANVLGNELATSVPEDSSTYEILQQGDFLREYHTSGHKINSAIYYPDKVKYDEATKRHFTEKVIRVSLPFQQVIATQHIVHLCGNDIRHELTSPKTDDKQRNLFLEFQQGWLDRDMEIAFYNLVKSVKITGDGAVVYYFDANKRICSRNLSYLNGDTLFPHYDAYGNLDMLIRRFKSYDESGNVTTTWLEVWDDRFFYTYKQSNVGLEGAINRVKDYFNFNGYSLVGKPTPHGFDQVPCAYMRADEPCWGSVQDAIDKYELAVSHLCQNNMAYAFPIMILKGESVEIQGDMYGAVKAITMGKDENAELMSRPESSKAFELQLKILLDMIFMGSFSVRPPEVHSGDLPGVAIKLIYSPSLEQAIIDAKEFDKAVTKMVELFKFGYGVEVSKAREMSQLKTFSWIEPYIHQNTAELINNLVMSANSGILSKETASDLTTYGKNDEFYRLIRQAKNEQEMDLLTNIIRNNDTNPAGGDTVPSASAED